MTKIYSASWVQPASAPTIAHGAVAVDGGLIVGVGSEVDLLAKFPGADRQHFDDAAIIPGLVNTHTHLELTVMRGYLENEERDFFSWLRKLTVARLELMTSDDLLVSATWGACEAVRAGITSVGDASDSALTSANALLAVGLRGIVFQESFGPDPKLTEENLKKLKDKIAVLREVETPIVRAGVSPHAPYTVCRQQLESIAAFAIDEKLPLMIHAAESHAEELFLREGGGLFAEGLTRRGIKFETANLSTIQYLKQVGILHAKPLLAHCIRVDNEDLDLIAKHGAKIAHCPKSNAKLGHGRAPLAKFLEKGIRVGLGSDSVASNNTCDILEEARFAVLLSRTADFERGVSAWDVFGLATARGAECLGLENVTGDLRPGLQADFAVLSLKGVHQTPTYDVLASAIFASSGRDVVATIIAGKEIYVNGRVTTVDEERLRERVREISRKLGDE
jgi:cytosine/adenosine deaminase-related metal-dependent hydrolase